MDVREVIRNKVLLLDGAMGTMLQKHGLKIGEMPEVLNFTDEDVVIDIHKEYIKAGADVITANTFGANEIKLKNTPYSVESVITKAVSIAKKASAGSETLIALDIGPIGQFIEPMGTLSFDDAIGIFKRMVSVGVRSGVDILLIETMADLYEIKAAVLACKETSTLPIFATMTFEEDERTFTGCLPESMAVTLEGLGVDAIGINCSLGPDKILPIVNRIAENTTLPIIVQPNAGIPRDSDGEAVYDMKPEEFKERIGMLLNAGASIIGGCCGTTPVFISNISCFKDYHISRRNITDKSLIVTPSNVVEVNGIKVIGERINPTGKKRLKDAIIESDIDYILRQAIEQYEAGADILDVNVGIPDIDESKVMVRLIKEIQAILDIPLQIDSGDCRVINDALRHYNGKAIVNSVNGDDEILDNILPIIKKYGAAVIGLTLDKNGIPETADERVRIAEKIVNKSLEYGIKKQDIYIDPLTLTVALQQGYAAETLRAIKAIKEELGVKTVLGISNISYGLPERDYINESFLILAMDAGLDMPIINPNKECIMGAVKAFNVLRNRDKNSEDYIRCYGNKVINKDKKIVTENETKYSMEECILRGLRKSTIEITEKFLENKKELDVVNEDIIPALDCIGRRYEKGEIFLPQLIQAAETVKNAFDIIKERLRLNVGSSSLNKGQIILATVEGDIHDIGKNIVKVILENYGYDIIDLGKDVNAERIVKEAVERNVRLVGLSALMTTTLKSMEKTIKALKESGFLGKIMAGGAVLTEDYAKKIGADYYAEDASASVKIAKEVFGDQ